jgi:hypothetical protein
MTLGKKYVQAFKASFRGIAFRAFYLLCVTGWYVFRETREMIDGEKDRTYVCKEKYRNERWGDTDRTNR